MVASGDDNDAHNTDLAIKFHYLRLPIPGKSADVQRASQDENNPSRNLQKIRTVLQTFVKILIEAEFSLTLFLASVIFESP